MRVGTRDLGRSARWRRPALIGASLALHALVLGAIGLRAIERATPPPAPPVVFVEIEPRPRLAGEPVRAARPALPDADTPPPAASTPAASRAPGDADRPSPPSPRLADPAPGAPPPPDDVDASAWRVRPQTPGERIGAGLRTRLPGCAARELLTAAEQAVCDTRFGERAAAAPPISGSGDAARDAAFAAEGARALARYEARRRPLSGGVGVIGPGDCPGSNLGAGCAGAHLAPGLRHGATTTHNGAQRD